MKMLNITAGTNFETLFHPWQNSGRPYISCIPQETTVGEKEVYIEVAETSALFTSPRGEESISKIYARCFEGFYGQLNEFCVECWFHNPLSLYSDRKRKVYLSECPGTFQPDFGSNEPLSKPGFALLPPYECFNGVCLFDKKPVVDKIQWIPLSCIPVLVVSIQQDNVGAVIFSFAEDHNFPNDLALTVISKIARGHNNLYGEQRYIYLSRVLGSKSLQLVRISDNLLERNVSLFSFSTYVAHASCNEALSAGEFCHIKRYNGTVVKTETKRK